MKRLEADERLEPLGSGMSIVVSDSHTFSTDAVLLADFARVKKTDKACDLGTGCGIIPLLWCKGETGKITAVEIQQKACRQLESSLEICNLKDRVEVINADLRNLKGTLALGSYDLVTMNPPYMAVGNGIESESEVDKIARHETMCTIDDAVSAAASLLRFSGRFCLCHKPQRLCDIICSMRKGRLEVKRIRFVVQKEGKEPWLVLVEGKRGAKSFVSIEKNLAIKNLDDTPSDELRRIFGDYMEGHQ